MIDVKKAFTNFQENGIEFFTGVPDSLLKEICGYITDNTSSKEHLIAANEGAAISLATGYHLATGKVALVYLQNSGLGNCINPLLSIADEEVYGIPMIIMIGWRGEPGIKDEPQHVKQGRVQNTILDAIEMDYEVVSKDTDNLDEVIKGLVSKATKDNKPVALIVSKNTFSKYDYKDNTANSFELTREDAIITISENIGNESIFVSTTGKASRELFEARIRSKQGNQNDFLTVGGMGHCNQIALGIALNSKKQVVCIDGDGAVLMHMGSLAIVGTSDVKNFVHIVINNGAHDSVGGQPTVGNIINLPQIAKASGYKNVHSVTTKKDLLETLKNVDSDVLTFIEVKVMKGARGDLGRPSTSPKENKAALMKVLAEK